MMTRKTKELLTLFAQGGGTHADLKLVGATTPDDLLVHFTAAQDAIAREGFRIGMDDVNQLGFTKGKKTSGAGWNFAFRADAFPDFWSEEFGPSFSTAGAGANPPGMVMFRSGGVECVHWDDFHQVIYWGAEVLSPILAFAAADLADDLADEWSEQHPSRQDESGLPRTRWISRDTSGALIFDGSLEEAIEWADAEIPRPEAETWRSRAQHHSKTTGPRQRAPF